jgi:hypothetical protein
MDGVPNNINITSSLDYSLESVENLYACVFKNKALDNIFLSHMWISTWLKCASLKPELITFSHSGNEEIVGFAFIGCVKSFLGSTYMLNQTGNHQDDQIWIEYNDVICSSNHQACRNALLTFLAQQPRAYKFTGINNIQPWSHKDWQEWSSEKINGYVSVFSSLIASDKEPSSSKTIKSNAASLTAHFSKNTKSQISRSQRFITQSLGEVQVDWLDNTQIEPAIAEMGQLHIEQWGEHSFGSGFSNPRFVEFHRLFMQQGLGDWVHLAKFSAGKQTLGYLYFFSQNKIVYFYLSAINYAVKDNKYKPGLLMHKLAMLHFESLSYTHYDFLAGDARYKTSLSNQKYLLHSMQLFVNKWYYRPIKICVNIKRWLIRTIG